MSNKIYSKGLFLKEINTKYGPMIKAVIKVDDFKLFLDKNNKDGWVNLNINKNKQPTEKGYTHHAVVNNWKPKQQTQERPQSNYSEPTF